MSPSIRCVLDAVKRHSIKGDWRIESAGEFCHVLAQLAQNLNAQGKKVPRSRNGRVSQRHPSHNAAVCARRRAVLRASN